MSVIEQQYNIDSPRNSESGSLSVENTSQTAKTEVHIDAKRYKTKMCRNFLNTGVCPYETRCMFAHGPHELRTPDENLRDGLVTESSIKRHQQQLMYMSRQAAQHNAEQQTYGSCTCPDCYAPPSTVSRVPAMYAPYSSYGSTGPYSSYTSSPADCSSGYCECADCMNMSYYSSPMPYGYDVYAP